MLRRNRPTETEILAGRKLCIVGYSHGVVPAIRASGNPAVGLLVLISPRQVLAPGDAVNTPTLVIGSTTSPGVTRAICAALPNARLALIDAGPELLRERPAEVLSLIEQFLDDPALYAPGTELQLSRP